MIKCNLCDFSFNGSYTRVRAHLLQLKGEGVRSCPKVSSSKHVEFKKLDNESTLKIEISKKKKGSIYLLYLMKEIRQIRTSGD